MLDKHPAAQFHDKDDPSSKIAFILDHSFIGTTDSCEFTWPDGACGRPRAEHYGSNPISRIAFDKPIPQT